MYSSGMETITIQAVHSIVGCLFLEVGVCLFSQFMVTTSVLKENEAHFFAVVEQCGSLRWFILKRLKK